MQAKQTRCSWYLATAPMSHFNCCCALGLAFVTLCLLSLGISVPCRKDFDKSQYAEMQVQTAHKSFTNSQSLFTSSYWSLSEDYITNNSNPTYYLCNIFLSKLLQHYLVNGKILFQIYLVNDIACHRVPRKQENWVVCKEITTSHLSMEKLLFLLILLTSVCLLPSLTLLLSIGVYYGLNICVPPNFLFWSITLQWIDNRRWSHWEVIMSWSGGPKEWEENS